jgi:hypothetical protein
MGLLSTAVGFVSPVALMKGDKPPQARRFSVEDVFKHPSLQTKVRATRIKILSNKATTRRTFMRTFVSFALFTALFSFFMSSPWPISRVSKIHHSQVRPAVARLWQARDSLFGARNKTDETDEAVLWDSACKNDDVVG